MKKLFLILVLILSFVVPGWSTTYYVDKRCENNGDGSAATCAESAGGAGAWNEIWYVLERANVPNGTNTVEIIEGSGPYEISDYIDSDNGFFRPQQQLGSTVTYNWNGNENRACWNVNDETVYKWTESTARSGQYYLTALDDSAPKLSWDALTAISDVNMCVINGVWNDATMNLSDNTSYKTHNWDWGDFDTLGFSTLYVKLSDESDPTDSSYEVWISRDADVNIGVWVNFGTFIFNDGIFSGGGAEAVKFQTANNELNRCVLRWTGSTGINLDHANSDNNTISFCSITDYGHRAIASASGDGNAVYNTFFNGPHLGIKLNTNAAITFTAKNNIFYNMYAGCVQHDLALPTFVESNNIFHIDPLSTHGGNRIAFTDGTPQWTTTDSTDFPASTATTNTVGTDPKVTDIGKLKSTSPGKETGLVIVGVNDDGELDIWGNITGDEPHIGVYQGAPIGGGNNIIQIGGGGFGISGGMTIGGEFGIQ